MLRFSIKQQLIANVLAIIVLSFVLFQIREIIGYYVVALILMFAMSLIAMIFDIIPVLVTAILSSIIWNFFFIPPIFTFHIDKIEDLVMFSIFFIIALVHAVMTFKIRKEEQKARDKEEKEKTIKLYNTLFNSLSHELRTPIAAIIGSVDTIKEGNAYLTENNKKELLLEIEKASLRLNRQVENLLNISRLETGVLKLKRDWCDINEIISTVIIKVASISQKHKISFLPNENLPLFRLDVALIKEMLFNILHNAILYTPQNTSIKISALHINEKCCIIISDNGNGFPEKEIPFVFDKFYRIPQTKSSGTGLGLSIVKGFVEAHEGTITLENNEVCGAKFTINIPSETTFINQLKNE